MSMGSKVAPSSASITGFKLKVRTFSFLSQHQTRTTPSCPFKPFNSPFNSNLKLINLFLILSTSDALKRTNFHTQFHNKKVPAKNHTHTEPILSIKKNLQKKSFFRFITRIPHKRSHQSKTIKTLTTTPTAVVPSITKRNRSNLPSSTSPYHLTNQFPQTNNVQTHPPIQSTINNFQSPTAQTQQRFRIQNRIPIPTPLNPTNRPTTPIPQSHTKSRSTQEKVVFLF
jgi:hypothetical protein